VTLSIPKPQRRSKERKPIARKGRPRKQRKSSLAAAKRTLWDAFSAFVKERDGNACFVCGKTGLQGSGWHAAHMFPSGSSSVLRYHPLNVFSGCFNCNINLGGNGAAYASRFIEVFGIDQFMYLNDIKRKEMKWREPDIRELIEALKKGGADYELKYAELIGSVFVPANSSPLLPADCKLYEG
jgi:hypothetical protein